jgi:nitrile hydratase beta subunit
VNGVHDMGGQMGYGPVEEEADEPTFHTDWESRAFGLSIAMSATGTWNIDMGRHARESLPPAEYVSSTYYEIWAKGLEKLLEQTGLVTAAELDAGHALVPAEPVGHVLKPDEVVPALSAFAPSERTPGAPARFAVGDRVVTRNMHPKGHTRLPWYARSKRGVVEQVHGAHVFPDANAHQQGEAPQWLYTVSFTGRELWGADADPTVTTSIDAWESYLEPA